MADGFTQKIKNAEKKHFPPHILVVDFSSHPGGIGALGEYFADQLSAVLTQKLGAVAVVDRKKFHDYLRTGGISPLDLRDREIATWIAGEVGANAIVFGKVTLSEEKLILAADLIRIEDDKHIASSRVDLLLDSQLKEMISKPLDWPAFPEVLIPCMSSESPNDTANSFKAAGISMPKCILCPIPDYTDEVRRSKIQGSVKFDVVIDEQGIPKRIAVVKGNQYGPKARAIDAIKLWKFKPAIKDGKPVIVCVVIEVTFRLI